MIFHEGHWPWKVRLRGQSALGVVQVSKALACTNGASCGITTHLKMRWKHADLTALQVWLGHVPFSVNCCHYLRVRVTQKQVANVPCHCHCHDVLLPVVTVTLTFTKIHNLFLSVLILSLSCLTESLVIVTVIVIVTSNVIVTPNWNLSCFGQYWRCEASLQLPIINY